MWEICRDFEQEFNMFEMRGENIKALVNISQCYLRTLIPNIQLS